MYQVFGGCAGQGGQVSQHFFGDQYKIVTVILGPGQYCRTFRSAQSDIGAIKFEARSTTATQTEVAQQLFVNACEYPLNRVSKGGGRGDIGEARMDPKQLIKPHG